MKCRALFLTAFFLGSALSSFPQTTAQRRPDATSSQLSNSGVEYPKDDYGVLINSSGWTEVLPDTPAESRVKRAIAASLTYGAIPSRLVAEYDGVHADVQLLPGRPILCVCHMPKVSDPPVLVRLHTKKNSRELDGGRIPVLRGKIGKADKSDLIEADVSWPETEVWLIQPRKTLLAGEYALMLGTRNMNIFPFTVLEKVNNVNLGAAKEVSRMKGPGTR